MIKKVSISLLCIVTILFTFSCNSEVNTTSKYTVNHKIQNIDNDDYTIKESETLEGKIGEKTAATEKTYEGFTVQEFSQKNN